MIPEALPSDIHLLIACDESQGLRLNYDSSEQRFVFASSQRVDPLHGTGFVTRRLLSFLRQFGRLVTFGLDIRRIHDREGTVTCLVVLKDGENPLVATCLFPTGPERCVRYVSVLADVPYIALTDELLPNPAY
jgi:hypothetical protein